MILVTGGTGFVGQVIVKQLVSSGHAVRLLLRPSPTSPNLPRSVSVEVAVCGLTDEKRLRPALKGVQAVIHLASAENRGIHADLANVDIEGTRILSQVAREVGVERIFYLSHLGADRASAFSVLKAKAIAEHFIIQSGIPYTIFRSALLFGPGDHFTIPLSRLLKMSPFVFLMPGNGKTLLQPLWVEDLAACMAYALEDPATNNQLYTIGGGEYLSLQNILEEILRASGMRRVLFGILPAYLRLLSILFEQYSRGFPVNIFLLDYLATDRTCPLDTLPRHFGLIPARFSQHLDHVKEVG